MNDNLEERMTRLRTLRDSLSATLEGVERELNACEAEMSCENEYLRMKRTHTLATYFKGKGLLITSLQGCTSLTKQKYALAKTIHNSQEALLPVVRFLYQRKGDEIDLSESDAVKKAAVCNFLTQLGKMGWICWTKRKDIVSVERKIPKAQYVFFNGGWAEDATRYLIEKTLHDVGVPHRGTYREVKVEAVAGQGDVHEFDFIVEFRDRIYIFETKTGSLGIERWIDHARMFNDADGLNRFLMCCNDDSLKAKLFQPYRLFHLKTLTEEFGEYVKSEFGIKESADGKKIPES